MPAKSRIRLGSLLVLLICVPAAADEWKIVSHDGFSDIFYEPASRQARGEAVAVDALTDYDPRSPEAEKFKLSEKGLSEVETVLLDCSGRRYRSDGGRWFEGHMASGAVRSAYPPKTEWSKVPSFYQGLFAAVCAKE